MAARHFLVTGASGFIGGHLAEACCQRGYRVTTIARPTSAVEFLQRLGVTIQRGDLTDSKVVERALENVDVVLHCAAKVGEWGPLQEYRQVNVDGLRCLLDACRQRPLQRLVHISTLGVYAARHHYGTDETEPLSSSHRDAYSQTKAEGEQLALEYQRDHGLPVVVLRPGFVYGPRDRTVLPRLIEALRRRVLRYIGDRQRAVNTLYIGNLVDAVFLAVDKPQAVGRTYNLTDGEYVSKKHFIEKIASSLDLPRPRPFAPPIWLARLAANLLEGAARRRGAAAAPRLTHAGLKLLGMNLDFSIQRAKHELGYQPRYSFDEGMADTIEWFKRKAEAPV